MDSIIDKLTLTIPEVEDSFRNTIQSIEQYNEKVNGLYYDIIDKKKSELKDGKYGEGLKDFDFDPAAGWYEDEQHFTFDLKYGSITISLTDVYEDPDGNFNDATSYIESKVLCDDNHEELEYFSIDLQECEYECLDNTLKILFTEIAKYA